MFFRSKAPVVDFVEVKNNQLAFVSPRALRTGRDGSVRVAVRASRDGSPTAPVQVYVQSCRATADGQQAYVGLITSELPFDTSTAGLAALRRGQRMDCSLRVMSPDLGSYTGVSVDFSLSGLQLLTRTAPETGRVLRLRLETTLETLPVIEVNARVAWCRPEGRKSHRLGLEFHSVTTETQTRLEELERFLRLRASANMTQLVLDCSDSYLLGAAATQA